jgi:phosphoglycolate phosphatase-like HAD superfamily hydrolase
MDRLVLFDIDCTLIEPHGIGGRAIFAALAETYGLRGKLDGYSFHGRTDPGIVIDLATRWGASAEQAEERLWPCLDRYLELLRDEAETGTIEVLPGVCELVAALDADPRVLVGLLTGNIAAGARIKLAPTGIDDLFKFGAYGDDARHRPDLPAIAVRRAAEHSGVLFSGKQIVIIGDTPADITCGAAAGVKAIAVATGIHSVDELAVHQPDHLFATLGDWRAVREAILA